MQLSADISQRACARLDERNWITCHLPVSCVVAVTTGENDAKVWGATGPQGHLPDTPE